MDLRQFERFYRPLLRWWWLIVLSMALAGITSWVVVRSSDPEYVSSGIAMVGNAIAERNPSTQQFDLSAGLATTYVRMAEVGQLDEATMRTLGMTWLPEHEFRVIPDSQLIQVNVTDIDPVRAQAVAAELINQLVLLSPGGVERQQREQFATEQIGKIEEGIAQAESSIETLRDELTTALSARQILQIEDRISAQESKLTTLRDAYIGLLQSTDQGSANSIRVVDQPRAPTEPIHTNDLLRILLATLLGGVLALIGIYAIELFDNRLRDVESLSEEFGIATLGVIPDMTEEHINGPLVMVSEPHSMVAESFRVLRTNLYFASVDQPTRILLVTSPGASEGKSSVCANLAVAFAVAGTRTLLVDADMRKPMQHRLFGLLNNKGVSTALLGGKSAITEAIQPTRVPFLSLMSSGPLPPNPSELLTSNKMKELLARLGSTFELVIVDSPPVTVVSDSAMLANRADGVLLVLSADNLGREKVRRAKGALSAVHAHILGSVLNRSSSDKLGFYYSYQSEYANKYYSSHYAHNGNGKRHDNDISLVPEENPVFSILTNGHNKSRFELQGAQEEKKPQQTAPE